MKRSVLSAALPLAFSLSACATVANGPDEPVPPGRPSGGECSEGPAQGLIGQKATSETGARALELTGASQLRWGPPGAMFTMDYRTDRVNVMYDDEMRITEIRCG